MLKEWEFGRDDRSKADCKALLKARREELAAKKTELEAKLDSLKKTNFIHARIAAAYPHLSEGEHNGENFRKLRDYIEQKRAEKKGKK